VALSLRPFSATLFLAGGVLLVCVGLYFGFVRPPLLPEDPRFMGESLAHIQTSVPGLEVWLRHVFWVMGGFMFASGVLTSYVANTAVRSRAPGAVAVLAISGAASIGTMAFVNVLIDSDFMWLLLCFALPWPLALIFYALERKS
jgi:hypothetical protein